MHDLTTSTSAHAQNSSRNGCEAFLAALISVMPPSKGETRESLRALLSQYADALEPEWKYMNRAALMQAQRKFRFFPTIAELADFLSALAPPVRERSSSSGQDDMHPAKVNNLARLAMRGWQRPVGRGLHVERKWEQWALGIAAQMVRDYRITGSFGRTKDGHAWTLDAQPSAPIVPDNLWGEWIAPQG